ncbi:MAG: bifunctional hydroxymethylpyrimidine kinase/phosphomethylpyrimidine kinase [bacterium]|jgi:D-beta-D-heptose 7-phosphate kinase/D-beta-D-heptose 1-phosphate adenosyltransferase
MSLADYRRILDLFPKLRIAVLGDVMLDRYVYGSVERISPEAPVPVLLREREACFPGGAANVAVNLAGLGATPLLIGIVGNDAAAELLKAELKSNNIDTSLLVGLPGAITTVKTRFVSMSQQLIRVDDESPLPIDRDAVPPEEVLSDCNALLVSDYNKGAVPFWGKSLIGCARRVGIPIVVDPKPPNWSYYQGCDVVTPNKKEARNAVPEHLRPVADLAATAKAVSHLSGVGKVVMTWGAEGMHVWDGASLTTIPSHRVSVFDPTGAGDTVIAALTASIAAGADLVTSANIANAAGAVAVAKPGIAAVTAAEVLSVLMHAEGV